MLSSTNKDYLDVVYDAQKKPISDYPSQMIAHLMNKYELRPQQSILEPGCGQANFLKWFEHYGMKAYGLDLSPRAGSDGIGIDIRQWDAEKDRLPFPDNSMDVVYSKSFVEHLKHVDFYFQEARRVLKPGGKLLSLTPDWEVNYRTFFDDPTHCRPFTKVSLETTYLMNGFTSVNVTKFRQLPITWKYPIVNSLSAFIAPFVPVRTKIKFLRWSRELMLIGYGIKPKE